MSLIVGPPALGEAPALSVSRNPSLGGRGVLSVAQPHRYLNLLADGDMELTDTSAWTSLGAVLSKETTTPHGGQRCLRVAYSSSYPGARQFVMTAGVAYHIVGWARGDGTWAPLVYHGSTLLWTGTSSNTWQRFDAYYVAGATDVRLRGSCTAAGYVEFDDVLLAPKVNVGLLIDHDMEALDTNAWTAVNNAVLSKQTSNPAQGTRLLRVTGDSVTPNPAASQTVLTIGHDYEITGKARSDGSSVPRVLEGNVIWTGTTSTDWQDVYAEFTATSTTLSLNHNLSTAYAEWDDIQLFDVT